MMRPGLGSELPSLVVVMLLLVAGMEIIPGVLLLEKASEVDCKRMQKMIFGKQDSCLPGQKKNEGDSHE